jgi:hypothetical protein
MAVKKIYRDLWMAVENIYRGIWMALEQWSLLATRNYCCMHAPPPYLLLWFQLIVFRLGSLSYIDEK